MNEDLLSIVFFAAITIFLVVKIKSILGREDFNHEEHMKKPLVPLPEESNVKKEVKGNVYTIDSSENEEDIIKDLDSCNDKGKENLLKITKKDPAFTINEFIEGAKGAFEMILKAYASEDIKTLSMLLDKSLLKEYEAGIVERIEKGEKLEHTLIGINKVEIHDALLRANKAKITVDFESDQINILTSSKGTVLSGDTSQIEKIRERWIFTRDMTSGDPNWTLIDTDEL